MWKPTLGEEEGTLTGRLLAAMRRDIRAGALGPGTRLPTHRELAHRLGVAVGTVTAAYGEATRQGLIEARVGRGSFVLAASPENETGDVVLSYNVPPLEPAARHFAKALKNLRTRRDLMDHLGYAPPAGFEAHRRAGAAWLKRRCGFDIADAGRMIVTCGAQQATALSLGALARPGEAVLVEAATFFGMKTLAHHAGYALHGVAMDAEGLLPQALDRAAAATGARVLYTLPTLQNPTGRIMSARRRADIAKIAQRRKLWIVEDDTFGAFVAGHAPPPLAMFAPDRTLYIGGLSKILAPGLRTAYLQTPDRALDEQIQTAIRATNLSLASVGNLIATQWIDDGTADGIADAVTAEIEARGTFVRTKLSRWLEPDGDRHCPHLWLPMPELEAERLAARTQRAGVQLTPPEAPIVNRTLISGVRLCVGGELSQARLEGAIDIVADALAAGREHSLALV
ncbi:MAG TPA: PLP-dependent aminotransferase family protein [Rhizomicrobium sp.]